MKSIEKEILQFLENLYGKEYVEYNEKDHKIYVSNEDSNNGYAISVETIA